MIAVASVFFLVTIAGGLFSWGIYTTESFVYALIFSVALVGPSAGIIAVGVFFSAIFAFYKEPAGYIPTKIVNIMFIVSMLLGMAWVFLNFDSALIKVLPDTPILVLFLSVVLGIGLYLNYKFQKTVNELTKSGGMWFVIGASVILFLAAHQSFGL